MPNVCSTQSQGNWALVACHFDADCRKCEGKFPCRYCTQRNLPCAAQDSAPSQLVLIHQALPKTRYNSLSVMSPLSNLSTAKAEPLVHYFFASFLSNNDFGVDLNHHMIYSELQASRSLGGAVKAIAAIDKSRSISTGSNRMIAIRSYRDAIVAFQQELQKDHVTTTSYGSWTTFFLGLFEVCP